MVIRADVPVLGTSILVASDFVLAYGIGDRVNPGTNVPRIVRKCGEAAWKVLVVAKDCLGQ
jgi:hypothetical protein